jgi:fructokinase
MSSARKELKRLWLLLRSTKMKPEFRFYRDQAADISLRIDELALVQPASFRFTIVAGLCSQRRPSASAYVSLVDRFFEQDIPVSLDPTVRKSLISDADSYLALLRKIAEKVSILKVSDEELQFMTGTEDFDRGVKALPMKKGALVLITLGKAASSFCRDGSNSRRFPDSR